MRVPHWYLPQLGIWALTAVPAYVAAALWGPTDWWLIPNIYDGDLSGWTIAFFTIFFFHPLITLPWAIASVVRGRDNASN